MPSHTTYLPTYLCTRQIQYKLVFGKWERGGGSGHRVCFTRGDRHLNATTTYLVLVQLTIVTKTLTSLPTYPSVAEKGEHHQRKKYRVRMSPIPSRLPRFNQYITTAQRTKSHSWCIRSKSQRASLFCGCLGRWWNHQSTLSYQHFSILNNRSPWGEKQ